MADGSIYRDLAAIKMVIARLRSDTADLPKIRERLDKLRATLKDTDGELARAWTRIQRIEVDLRKRTPTPK